VSSSSGRSAAESGQAFQRSGGYPQGASYAPEPRDTGYAGQRRSGGAGALAGSILAGALMIISGATGFLAGLAMVIKGSFFTYNSTYAYHWSTKGWGWVELIIGAVIFFAGICVLLGMTWARVVGVIIATLGAIASFLTIPYYPVWSIVVLAMDVFIIWALVHRGRQVHE
jgi:hypothetical protein